MVGEEPNPYASPGSENERPAIEGPDAIPFAGDIDEPLLEQAARLDARASRSGWWIILCLVLAPMGAAANLILSGDVTWAVSLSVVFAMGVAGLLANRGKAGARPPVATGPFSGAASPEGIDLRLGDRALRLDWQAVLGQMADAEMVLLYSAKYAACFAFPARAFKSPQDWGRFCELVIRQRVPRAGK